MIPRTGSTMMIAAMTLALCAATAPAQQSSSLYLAQTPPPQVSEQGKPVNPYMQRASYLAVSVPEPRQFRPHDLVTIIVREASSSTSEGELQTEKEVGVEGSVEAMIDPEAFIKDLRITPAKLSAGVPAAGVEFSKEFEGDGEYERRDEVVTRLTARVLDVKPNGTLALEARTHIANDDETVTIVVTGYCRAEDVAADNTILSTQMYDLRVEKKHTGEIRDASKKGVLTKALEFLFNF